jgi:hypothetical protein
MLIVAKRQHDARPKPGQTGYLDQASQDAVTVWRRMAHLVNNYANGAAVRGIRPTWEAFWVDGIDRAGMLALIAERSRFNRCGEDGEARLYDDSVTAWEYRLAREVMWSAELVTAARKGGDAVTVRRIELDHGVAVLLTATYTGLDTPEIRQVVKSRAGEDVTMTFASTSGAYASHPLFDLITANRPTV